MKTEVNELKGFKPKQIIIILESEEELKDFCEDLRTIYAENFSLELSKITNAIITTFYNLDGRLTKPNKKTTMEEDEDEL